MSPKVEFFDLGKDAPAVKPPVASPPPQVPPPADGATKWFTCSTDGCRVNGYVATGTSETRTTRKKAKCRSCQGIGQNEEAGYFCEACGGRGWNWKEESVSYHPTCPVCKEPMVLVASGPYPVGYPRLDMGGQQGNDYTGGKDVGFRWHPPS